MPMVELFGTSWCEFTSEMREWLEVRGVDFVEYDVERDRVARARLTTIASDRTVPVLVEDGKVVQIGWHGRGCTVS